MSLGQLKYRKTMIEDAQNKHFITNDVLPKQLLVELLVRLAVLGASFRDFGKEFGEM